MDWLLLTLQVLFWMPMAYRVITRKTPETNFLDELVSSFRSPGLLLYEIALLVMWAGLGMAAWTGELDRHVTLRGALGACLHVMATALFAWAVASHRSWNMEARLEPDHQLCTVGPYRFVRHPIYVAFNLLAVGTAIWMPNAAVILGAILLALGGDIRARAEERVLTNRFGDVYRDYMQRVYRMIPGLY